MHECTASRFPLERRRVIVSTMKHAIVIGSGFGGLAAAVRLGVRGYRVTVLEKLDAPGGRAYVYHRDGYTFDGGPTIITAPYLFEDLWQLCGKRLADDVTLRSLDPFYLVRFDDGVANEGHTVEVEELLGLSHAGGAAGGHQHTGAPVGTDGSWPPGAGRHRRPGLP